MKHCRVKYILYHQGGEKPEAGPEREKLWGEERASNFLFGVVCFCVFWFFGLVFGGLVFFLLFLFRWFCRFYLLGWWCGV